ncbi:MAG: radical SAM protein [Firmicutes bacterium]|nr:radical SAM protein [Bacillota bacterium]
MSFDIEIGTKCNNSCIFCSAARRESDFSTEQALQLIKEHGADGGVLCITGGEPTVRQDFLQIISTAVNAGYNYTLLQSNGRAFADPELAKEVVNLGFINFLISVHGVDAEMHDAHTQVAGSFEQTMRGIGNLLQHGADVSTLTVITKINCHSLEKITEMLISTGISIPVFAFPMLVGKIHDNFDAVVPRYEEMGPHLIKSFELIEKNDPELSWTTNVQDVPFCFLKGRERYANEINYAETSTICFNSGDGATAKNTDSNNGVFYLDNEIENRIQNKKKPPSCEQCIYYQPCEGIQQAYIDCFGISEFAPVTSPDTPAGIKEQSLTLRGDIVPVLDASCQFNGRNFGGFLIKNERLIVVTKRGRQALKLFTGEHTLSEIHELCGADILSFLFSLRERNVLDFSDEKGTLQDSRISELQNHITQKNSTEIPDGPFELPLYIPWHKSYKVSLI